MVKVEVVGEREYSCTSEFVAELLMVISAFLIALLVIFRFDNSRYKTLWGKLRILLLSIAYAIFLPLLSFIFGQAKLYYPKERAQVILVWMVFIEIIRTHTRQYLIWSQQKPPGEQIARLLYVSFLIISYSTTAGLKVSLLFLCVVFIVYEVLKGFIFTKAKNSYLIGENPKLINSYIKRIMLQYDLQKIKMNTCEYIVMGENYHKITVDEDGYLIGERICNSRGMLTIGRVFRLDDTEDEAFTLAHPKWRDICLSLALAKMLRQRFARLPLEEDGNPKSLSFVEDLIDYMGCINYDFQNEESNGQTNPIERVFSILEDELKFVSSFLHTKAPAYHYFEWSIEVYYIVSASVLFSGIYIIYTIFKSSSSWVSLVRQDTYYNCFFNLFRRGTSVGKIFSYFDRAITILLFIACIYVRFNGEESVSHPWSYVRDIEEYFNNPTKCKKCRNSFFPSSISRFILRPFEKYINKVLPKGKKFKNYSTVFKKSDSIFGIRVGFFWAYKPPWLKGRIPTRRPTQIKTAFESTHAKQAILKFLKENGSQLTNGETSLRKHGMEHLKWACRPSKRITEAILIWHIATILFEHQQPEQKNDSISSQQNNHQINKEREVALTLSNYCHYLVMYFPELLPGKVEWIKDEYENVRKVIWAIGRSRWSHRYRQSRRSRSSYRERLVDSRCDYALKVEATSTPFGENTVLGKGTRLAMELQACTEGRMEVWSTLADFWAEMILFIAPSDNVEGHEKILERNELITQIWALLSHAGIIKRSEPAPSLGPIECNGGSETEGTESGNESSEEGQPNNDGSDNESGNESSEEEAQLSSENESNETTL